MLESITHNITTIKHSTKTKHPPSYFKDYLNNSLTNQSNDSSLSINCLISNHCVVSINTLHELKTYVEASKIERWNQAMQVDLSAR